MNGTTEVAQNDLPDADQNLATPDNSRNCTESPALPLAFTVITSIQPARLTKVIGINATGGMRKETSAMLSRGQAQRVAVADLHGLKSYLDTLTSAQAVTWGVTKDDTVGVCTQGDAEAQQAGAIARIRENFKFGAAAGVMMLDHDGLPEGELSPMQFRDRLLDALDGITRQNGKLKARILARLMERHAGQLCTGLHLVLADRDLSGRAHRYARPRGSDHRRRCAGPEGSTA